MNGSAAVPSSPDTGRLGAALGVVRAFAARLAERPRSPSGQRAAELQGIFDHAAAGILEFDLPSNRLVHANRSAFDLLGRTEADLRANAGPDRWAPDGDWDGQAAQWAAIRETGRPFACERQFTRNDGTVVWAQIRVSATALDRNGKPRRLCAILHDITARKAAEAALLAHQDLLRLALEIGRVGTFRRDYLADRVLVDAQTRSLHALTGGSDPVTTKEWFATIMPADRGRMQQELAKAQGGRQQYAAFSYRFRHPERGVRYAETRSRITYDAAGRALGSVGVIIDVTERRIAEDRLTHLAHHDPLTDLPNRSLFVIRLDEAIARARSGDGFAILSIDLDGFKDVNDTLGHHVGDGLLRIVAARLRAACRKTDTVARIGGDEFAVIQTPLLRRTDATSLAARLAEAIAVPYMVEGDRIVIASSIGTTIAPEDGSQAERLLHNADLALYGAKTAGRGQVRAFGPAMEETERQRRALDADLRSAFADGAFELFYQPIITIGSGRLRGFEALIRWRHPTRGLIAPDQFIPFAERNGLIVPIGAFVLHQACADASAWPGEVAVAINLSATEFTNPGLVDAVVSALNDSGIDPARLELEITETTMLQDTGFTLDTLNRLKSLGIRLSIDDFGTGFSSLSYLQRFPFDKVKIDRSFISPLGTTPASLTIVRSIVALCAALELQTTAEGVETSAQLDILTGLGCTEAQGYFISRPVPNDQVAALLTAPGAAVHSAQL